DSLMELRDHRLTNNELNGYAVNKWLNAVK
ncbi:hypothetical protein D046_2519B, partial [Vibrio parahaemolyticus V-223/04]